MPALQSDVVTASNSAAFEQLRIRFVQGLETRMGDIRAQDDISRVVAASHKLAGAAGSFGFFVLSELARNLEHSLADGLYDADILAKLEEEVLRIRRT